METADDMSYFHDHHYIIIFIYADTECVIAVNVAIHYILCICKDNFSKLAIACLKTSSENPKQPHVARVHNFPKSIAF